MVMLKTLYMYNSNKSMKLFFQKIAIVLTGVICCLLAVWIYKICMINRLDWTLPSNIHTVFLGASQPNRGINPDLYPNSINLASPSERYMFTYLKLCKLLDKNSQVDTVFLQFAPTDVWKDADNKYFAVNEMKYFIPYYASFFSWEEVCVYKNCMKSALFSFLSRIYTGMPTDIHSYGGFEPLDKKFDRNKRYSPQMIQGNKEGNKVNINYLLKIKELCEENDCKLYLIYFPMFEPEDYYDQDYYQEIYNKFLKEIELLNFRDIEIPDSLRYDEHHLNIEGAIYFTDFLNKSIHQNDIR